MTKALIDFFDGPNRCQWLVVNGVDIFMRKSFRLFNGETYDRVVDLANVEIKNERFQCKGKFTQLVEDVTMLANNRGYQALYVENVLTPRFEQYFVKRRWERVVGQFSPLNPPCFYKFLEAGRKPMTDAQMQLIADLAVNMIWVDRENGADVGMRSEQAVKRACALTLKIATGLGVSLGLSAAAQQLILARVEHDRRAKGI
jgi:hypothetical protein